MLVRYGLLLGIMLLGCNACAYEWTDPDTGISWRYFIDKNGTAVFEAPDVDGCIKIPSTLGGCPVKCIAELTFENGRDITSVIIPKGVENIYYRAFDGCHALKSVSIPEGVLRIYYRVFGNCRSLATVTIPASVEFIDGAAFDGCSSLREINVSKGSKSYVSKEGVLFDITGRTLIAFPGQRSGNYDIPEGVTNINEYAFSGCKFLTSVTMPASMRYIGDTAFYYSDSITNLIFAGDAPDVDRCFFMSMSDRNNCVVTVWEDAKGWNVDEKGHWHGFKLMRRARR